MIDVARRGPGAKRLAVEDPCADDDAVPVARAAGLEVVGVPVGDDGVRVDALDRLDADALVLTPSHQWPTGAVLSAERRAGRAALGARARRAGHRGRLRRRVPLRPRADRRHAGPRARPRRLRRHGEQDARARAAARLARAAARPRRRDRRRRRRWPTAARPCSTSWPSPTSWHAASSTATCAGCARSTAAGATRCSRALREQHARARAGRHRRRPAPRRLAARRTSTRRRSSPPPPSAAWPSHGLAPYRISAEGRPGLIFGYATLDERALTEAVALLAEAIRAVPATPSAPSSRGRRSR